MNRAAGRAAVRIGDVVAATGAAGVSATFEVPSSAAEMREMIDRAADGGITHFAVVGGDGTVNVAANALLAREGLQPVLGVLPAGTGCDLLRTFGIPQDLGEAAHHLATEDTYPIDVVGLTGSWGTRYCVNVAQVGVGAAAAETAQRVPRGVGSARYPIAFVARLPRFPRTRVEIVTERRTHTGNALAVIVANAQFFAGGWNVAPRATLVDGVADLQIIDTAKTRAPALVPKIIRGTHLRDRAVRSFTAAEFEITTAIPWPLEADGDLIGNTPVSGKVVRAALHLKI